MIEILFKKKWGKKPSLGMVKKNKIEVIMNKSKDLNLISGWLGRRVEGIRKSERKPTLKISN